MNVILFTKINKSIYDAKAAECTSCLSVKDHFVYSISEFDP